MNMMKTEVTFAKPRDQIATMYNHDNTQMICSSNKYTLESLETYNNYLKSKQLLQFAFSFLVIRG